MQIKDISYIVLVFHVTVDEPNRGTLANWA